VIWHWDLPITGSYSLMLTISSLKCFRYVISAKWLQQIKQTCILSLSNNSQKSKMCLETQTSNMLWQHFAIFSYKLTDYQHILSHTAILSSIYRYIQRAKSLHPLSQPKIINCYKIWCNWNEQNRDLNSNHSSCIRSFWSSFIPLSDMSWQTLLTTATE